jgi:hypothetical protein
MRVHQLRPPPHHARERFTQRDRPSAFGYQGEPTDPDPDTGVKECFVIIYIVEI